MNSGVVTIIGRPSSGKSTFLNTASGEKISIVSPVPQTTRNAIRGIVNTNKGQIVFVDTPGYHICERKLNGKLKDIAEKRLDEADAVLYLIDQTRKIGEEEKAIFTLLNNLQEKLVIGLNKSDICIEKKDGENNNSAKLKLLNAFPLVPKNRIIEISALKGNGINEVLSALIELLPEGEALYPSEFYTDQDVIFRMTEIIREKAILNTRQEIPHSLYASIEDAESRNNGKRMWVRAFLYVEKESQKAMLIGKNAHLIKTIRIQAETEMRKIFPYKVNLDLQVRVNKNWRQKDYIISSITQ